MPGDKEARIGNNPKGGKNARVSNNPESYLNMPISWQFSLMDFSFEYGWEHVVHRIQFTAVIKDNLLISLVEANCDEELYNVIDNIGTSDYTSINNFLTKLQYVKNITIEQFLCIMEVVQKRFFWDELFPKLKKLESSQWSELEKERAGKKGKSKHHQVQTSSIIKEAKDRLIELKLDDHEELYSIRLTGTQRLWGIRRQNYFKILWFDFNHDICPSLKD